MNVDDKMKELDDKFDEIVNDLDGIWPKTKAMARRAFNWGLGIGLVAGFLLGWMWT